MMSFALEFPVLAGVPHSASHDKYIEVYAHRGARSFSPENTIAAYQTGLALGTNWVDLDVGITKDGVIVVAHDLWLNPDILRKNGQFWAKDKETFYAGLANAPGGLAKNIQPYLIKNLTFAELEQYDAGMLNPNSPYAKYFPAQFALNGSRMPSLQTVVEYVDKVTNKRVKFQIEIKSNPQHPNWTLPPQDFARRLDQLLRNNNLVDRVEVQSFDWQPLFELQKIDPQLKTAYLISSDGIQRMKGSNLQQAGLWSGGKLLKDYNNSIPQMIKSLGGACYEPEDAALSKDDLEEAHRLGLKVVVWGWPEHIGTAFDHKLIAKLIDWGVDGIITDDPAQLNALLAARGLPTPPKFIRLGMNE